MKRSRLACMLVFAVVLPAWCADTIKWPVSFDRLAKEAKESVDVTLDSSMLQLASGFLEKNDPDQAHVKRLVSKLRAFTSAASSSTKRASIQWPMSKRSVRN